MRGFLIAWAVLVAHAQGSHSEDVTQEDPDSVLDILQERSTQVIPAERPRSPLRYSIDDEMPDPILQLVQHEKNKRSLTDTAHVRPCDVPSSKACLLLPVPSGSSFSDYALSVIGTCYLILMTVLFRILECHCEKDLVSIRSPLILKISSVTGFVSILCMWFSPYWPSIFGSTWLPHFTWALAVVVPISILPHVARALGLRCLYKQQRLILKSSEQCAAIMPQDFRAKLFDLEEKVHQLGVACSERARAAVLAFIIIAVMANGVMLELLLADCPVENMRGAWSISTPCLMTCVVGLVLCWSLRTKDDVHGAQREVLFLGAAYLLLVKLLLFGPAQWYQLVVSAWILVSQLVPLLSMVAVIHKRKILDWLSPFHSAPSTFSVFFSSPICRGYFYQFLCASFHPEIMQFWQDLEEYRTHFDDEVKAKSSSGGLASSSRPKTASRLDHAAWMRVTARNIFNKYIRDGALMHVDLPEAVTQEVNYRLHSNNITAYTFVAAQEHIFGQMESSYAEFLCHPLSSGCFSRAHKIPVSPPL